MSCETKDLDRSSSGIFQNLAAPAIFNENVYWRIDATLWVNFVLCKILIFFKKLGLKMSRFYSWNCRWQIWQFPVNFPMFYLWKFCAIGSNNDVILGSLGAYYILSYFAPPPPPLLQSLNLNRPCYFFHRVTHKTWVV